MKPATVRTWRVLWYEVQRPRHMFNARGHASVVQQRAPKRRKVFTVEGLTHDTARREAIAEVRRHGVRVVSVNSTTRPNEFVIYSEGKSA